MNQKTSTTSLRRGRINEVLISFDCVAFDITDLATNKQEIVYSMNTSILAILRAAMPELRGVADINQGLKGRVLYFEEKNGVMDGFCPDEEATEGLRERYINEGGKL